MVQARGDELPEGVLFISYGTVSSRLMGGDTHGTGMPDSKGIDMTLSRFDDNQPASAESK